MNNTTINGAAGRNQHPNGVKDVSFNSFAGGTWTGTQCQNTYCHSKGTGGTLNPGETRGIFANTATTWGGSTTCGSCHGNEPGNDGTGLPWYANGSPKANSHTAHSSYTCEICHYPTTTTGNTITDYTKHVNKLYDVGNQAGTLTYVYNVAGGTCSGSFGCHMTATWGTTLGCLDCHMATDGSTWKSPLGAPIVYNTSQPTYGDPNFSSQFSDGKRIGLAAGNFYWTTEASASGQSRGHSLGVIPYKDDTSNHSYDPRGSCATNCHGRLDDKGCESCHVVPAHHSSGSSGGWADKNNGYYRFLGPLPASADHKWGVRGYEDPNWQKNASQTVHNEYSGEAVTTDYHSISAYCLGCHDSGSYPDLCASDLWSHNATMVLPDNVGHVGSLWAGYRWCKPAGEHDPLSLCDYHPMLPIARSNITSYTSPSDNVTYGSNDTLTCLTCHRAHASPYNHMLRWDNAVAPLPELDFNCGDCHIP